MADQPSITERLRAALDSAGQQARAAEKRRASPWHVGAAATVTNADQTRFVTGYTIANGFEIADYIAAWHPTRILALVERDRALLADVDEYEAAMKDHPDRFSSAPSIEQAHGWRLDREVRRAAEFWLGEDTPK